MKYQHSIIELYGIEGSMLLPDPNYFGGELKISKKDAEWEIIDTTNMMLGIPNKEDNNMVANYRGIGLSDMVDSIINKKKARCSLEISLHVLEIMEGFLISSENSNIYKTITTCAKPEFLSEQDILKLKV